MTPEMAEKRRARDRERRRNDGVIRAGDTVRVVHPLFVVRVGYPRCVADYVQQAERLLDATVAQAFPGKDGEMRRFLWKGSSSHFFDRATRAYARWLAEVDGFGGRERSVHAVEVPELAGTEACVTQVWTAATGEYYPPRGGHGYNSYTGDYDDAEPGGLAHQKAHRIAEIWIPTNGRLAEAMSRAFVGNRARSSSLLLYSTMPCDVEVCNLEKVRGGEGGGFTLGGN